MADRPDEDSERSSSDRGGQGPLHDRLNEQIIRSGLSEQVRLLGFLPDTDLPLAYRAADLSIDPSQALEGFGLTTLESLAASITRAGDSSRGIAGGGAWTE